MDDMPPMTFSCDFSSEGASPGEIDMIPHTCPPNLREFWSVARTARLFEDTEYGQWGLEILPPQRAVDMIAVRRTERQRDFIAGDLVIGEFLGDSDLLVIRCDESKSDFGEVLIASPIDPRSDWDRAAESFADFLDKYARSGGEKYWAPRR